MGFGQGQVQLFRAKMETLSVIPFPKRDRLNDNTTHTLPLSAPLPPPSPPPIHHYSHGFEYERLVQHNFLSFNKHHPSDASTHALDRVIGGSTTS